MLSTSARAALRASIPEADALRLWERYKATFVQSDGRVIDIRQNGISHSESQGYGLLVSVLFNDRKTFQTVWNWTRNNLQARKDNLLPWAWGRRHNGLWQIIDYNNATDGDVLVAYALLKASVAWNVPEYRADGMKIMEGIRKHLAVSWQDRTYLLPAYYGFQKEGGVVLNPSYQIVSAYRAFSGVDEREFWHKVYTDSLYLLQAARFGRFRLPADWVRLDGSGITIWDERAPLFGYEAVRTLLYLSWDQTPRYPEGVAELLKIYEKERYLPTFVNLQNNTISLDDAPAGFYAIFGRVAEKIGKRELGRELCARAIEKAEAEKNDYYSMTLLLLSLHSVD
jgi:endoglucanase